jgi:sulfite reductase beta subunit-like hemoprotein
MTKLDTTKLIGVSATANIINRCEATVRSYADQGKLSAMKLADGSRLFHRDDVERFAEKMQEAAKGR